MKLGVEEFVDHVIRTRPDVVAFSVVTMAYPVTRSLCRRLRERGFDGPIVLGGNHVTALPELALNQTGATAVVRNEGEVSFTRLVRALEASLPLAEVPGISWIDNGTYRATPNAPTIANLDDIPFPAWDLMPPKTFPDAPHQLFSRQFPVAPVMTSRGCPYTCTYCASQGQWGRTWRRRSLDNVMEEITLLVEKYGVREIHFEDDEFLAREDRVLELCERLASSGLDLIWSLPNGVRTNAINDRVAAALRRAGCYEVGLGIDAPFEHQQERVQKLRDPGTTEMAIETLQRHGLQVRGFWIIGHDVDSEEDVEREIEYILSLPTELGAFGVSAPLPGSPDFERFKRDVDLETFEWERISYFKALDGPRIPAERLQKLLRRLVLRFYLRPRQVRTILSRIRPQQAEFIAAGLYRYLTGAVSTGTM
jgi:radical SAM superfamily enzyme YgiQ (UPF0313 family)